MSKISTRNYPVSPQKMATWERFVVVLVLNAITLGKADVHYMCQSEDIQLKEADITTVLHSQNYPNAVPDRSSKDCTIHITAAADLKMEISVEDVNLPSCGQVIPPQGSCIYGCDHLYMHEADAPEQSTNYIFGDTPAGTKYTTTTRRLYLKFCRHSSESRQMKFSLRVTTLEKKEKIIVDDLGRDYYISSHYFPAEYHIWSGNDTYHFDFYLGNTGHLPVVLLLNFTDWNMHPQSEIEVKQLFGSRIFTAAMARPFLYIRDEARFAVIFRTGKDPTESHLIPVHPHHLWKAKISSTGPAYDSARISGCGTYFNDVWGGDFKVSDASPCKENGEIDCVFVMARKERDNTCFENFILRFTSLRLQSELGDSLEVRNGTTSDGVLLWRYFDESTKVFRGHDGYYVHFRGKCHFGGVRLSAVFASTRPTTSGKCEDSFKCGNNEMYIPRRLVCNGVEHCFDGTDESDSFCGVGITERLCHSQDLRSCNDIYREKFCSSQACDGVHNCPGGEDERNCNAEPGTQSPVSKGYSWGTIIPIVLSCLVVAFIMCLLISLFVKMKRAQRHSPSSGLNGHSSPHYNHDNSDFFAESRPPLAALPHSYSDEGFPLTNPPPYSPPLNESGHGLHCPNTTHSADQPLSIRSSVGQPVAGRLYRDEISLQQCRNGFPLTDPPPYSPPLNQSGHGLHCPNTTHSADQPLSIRPSVGQPVAGRLYRDEIPLHQCRNVRAPQELAHTDDQDRSIDGPPTLTQQNSVEPTVQTRTQIPSANFVNQTNRAADVAPMTVHPLHNCNSSKSDQEDVVGAGKAELPVLNQTETKSPDNTSGITASKNSPAKKKKKTRSKKKQTQCMPADDQTSETWDTSDGYKPPTQTTLHISHEQQSRETVV